MKIITILEQQTIYLPPGGLDTIGHVEVNHNNAMQSVTRSHKHMYKHT